MKRTFPVKPRKLFIARDRMADNSKKFDLRWEIDGATAQFAKGTAESGEFNEGGFKWTVGMSKREHFVDFHLRCGTAHAGCWKCAVKLDMFLLRVDGTPYHFKRKEPYTFDDADNCVVINSNVPWWYLDHADFMADDKTTFELRIQIISSELGESVLTIDDEGMAVDEPFAAPSRMTNVILKIGDNSLHVYKELLAFHSPFFETLFFGNFAESGMKEVELKDVVYEEFLDLLQYICLTVREITDHTALHLLKLADQYQIETVRDAALTHITRSEEFDVMKKLIIADHYNIAAMRDHCLNSFTDIMDLVEQIKSSSEYDNFSLDLKGAILNRIMKI